MGHKALVTLDLPDVSDSQRKFFYEKLESEKWYKIRSLTTVWRMSYDDGFTWDDVVESIKDDLLNAKRASGVKKVEYALQIHSREVVVAAV
jgi:hypothetical protein